MANTNQTTTGLVDMISKLNTFLAAQGWTTTHTPASGEWAARKTSSGVDVALATQWEVASPDHLGIYQWNGAAYNTGASPWAQNNDSGTGAASTTNSGLAFQRIAGNLATCTQFWCYEEDFYFHVVVEESAGKYVHFGAGSLEKFNDWTGGDYVYGHRFNGTSGSNYAVNAGSTGILDGLVSGTNLEQHAATVYLTGMLNQPAGGLYGVVMGAQNAANLGQDRQGTPKDRVHLMGGFRAGPSVLQWGMFYGNIASGLLPGYPITIFHRDVLGGSPTNDIEGPLGRMKDVRGMSIKNYAGGDEITIGGDTWVIFPQYTKGAGANTSGNQGIIYKKIA
jgi:hypothetical protein